MQDATALAAAIREGRTTALDVMEATLSTCVQRADLGAVVHLDAEMALRGARAADAAPPEARGHFHGVPFLIKDLGVMARGLPVSAGLAALREAPMLGEIDDDFMIDLKKTGLVPFGVSATPPCGIALSTEPEGLPPTRNPWNPNLTPGGSSGGAAAAVAGGLVAIAHATDAAGSIRVPAACCGLTGLKPSRGTMPGGPDFSNHLMGLASGLVLARSIRDVAHAFRSVAKPFAPTGFAGRPKIGFAVPDLCGESQRRAVIIMAEALADAGCHIREVPSPDDLGAEAHSLAWKIISVAHAEGLFLLELSDEEVPPLATALAEEARAFTPADVFAMTRELARLSFAAQSLFTDCDLLLTSVLSGPPPAVGAFDLSGRDTERHRARMAEFAPNVALANVMGLPALALPFGTANGLPLGAQLLGPIGSDAELLRLGAEIETRAPALDFPQSIAGLPV